MAVTTTCAEAGIATAAVAAITVATLLSLQWFCFTLPIPRLSLPAMDADANNRRQVDLIRRWASITGPLGRTAILPLGRTAILREEEREVFSFLNDIKDDIGETRRHLNIITTLEDVATPRSHQLFAFLQPEATANDGDRCSRSRSRPR